MNSNHSRWLKPLLDKVLTTFPVVVVAGARQVGKTTLVRDLGKGPARRYYSLDSLDVLSQAQQDPDSLLEELPVTLDEVQRAPELLLAVKRAVDRERKRHLDPWGFVLHRSSRSKISFWISIGVTSGPSAPQKTLISLRIPISPGM